MRALSRRSGLVAVAAAAIALSLPASAETDDAIARLLAETAANKQARAAHPAREHKVERIDRPRPEEERRLIDEIEMLERARAEAEARRIENSRAQSTARNAAQAAAARRAEEERQAADERWASDERRRVEEQKRADDARRVAEAAQRQADAERKIAADRRRSEEAEYARMEAEREAEAAQIDEALRKARAARAERQNARAPNNPTPTDRFGTMPPPHGSTPAIRDVVQPPPDTRDQTRPSNRPADTVVTPASDALRSSTRVTVLMVLEPGDRGIRRHNKSADPLLCGEKGCYVGTGAATPANFLPRHRAFGAARTLGDRAGACRNSLGCVFRGIDLVAYPAVIQPIDMRFLRHDRREPHVLDETSRCRLDAGRLSCTPVVGPDYVMWIVPERIAEQAGPRELARAVEAGLRAHSAAIVVRD